MWAQRQLPAPIVPTRYDAIRGILVPKYTNRGMSAGKSRLFSFIWSINIRMTVLGINNAPEKVWRPNSTRSGGWDYWECRGRVEAAIRFMQSLCEFLRSGVIVSRTVHEAVSGGDSTVPIEPAFVSTNCSNVVSECWTSNQFTRHSSRSSVVAW